MKKIDLTKTDYLEIMDIETEDLLKYSKKELIACIWQLTMELHDKESK